MFLLSLFLGYTVCDNTKEIKYRNIINFDNLRKIDDIYIENGLNEKELARIQEGIDKTGMVAKNFFEKDGIVIYQYKIKDSDDGHKLNGRYIVIQGTDGYIIQIISTSVSDIKEVVVHEFGHHLDNALGKISNSTEFVFLYEKYKGIPLEIDDNINYVSSKPSEFFAERYMNYILYGEQLKEHQPEIYDLMKKYINDLENN